MAVLPLVAHQSRAKHTEAGARRAELGTLRADGSDNLRKPEHHTLP